jgi:hypothetical protein
MPILSSDLHLRLSILTGTAGNQNAQPTPNGSLGKYVSTTDIVDATLDNLFDDVTGDENAASTVDFRCLFIYNANATLTLLTPVVWQSADVAGGANVAIAIDNLAASAVAAAAAQAAQIASDTTPPTGVGAFSTPTTKAAGLAINNLPNGQVRGIWVQRTATNSAALNNDGCTLRVEGDTTA